MVDIKQILVVDDTAEMLEFLRSMLQVSNSDHQVVAVPSAEEAEFELRLTNFDLLITDVRLPGKSGFDLVRRAQRIRPEMPVIMITAYLTDQGRQEAEELGVYRYFGKPLDTDSILTAVHHTLYGEPEIVAGLETVAPVMVNVALTDEMEIQLDGLRDKTGAFGLLLVAGGQVVYESGGHRDLHPDRIATIVNQKMAHSSMLAEELGEGDTTFNLLYQTGARYEMYSVNIGRDYFVTLLFEASERRGRIGTVWIFVQRAAKDLLKILPELNLETAVAPAEPLSPQVEATAPPPELTPTEPTLVVPPPITTPEPEPEPKPEPIQLSEEEMVEFAGLFEGEETADATVDLDAFWDSAFDDVDSAGQERGGISLVEAQKMGLVALPDLPTATSATTSEEATAVIELDESEAEPIEADAEELESLFSAFEPTEAEVDLDAFWDSALGEGEESTHTRGISLADAIKQGLVSNDFEAQE